MRTLWRRVRSQLPLLLFAAILVQIVAQMIKAYW